MSDEQQERQQTLRVFIKSAACAGVAIVLILALSATCERRDKGDLEYRQACLAKGGIIANGYWGDSRCIFAREKQP